MRILQKFQDKKFVQDLLVELIGDVIMIAVGLLAGYYIKVMFFG